MIGFTFAKEKKHVVPEIGQPFMVEGSERVYIRVRESSSLLNQSYFESGNTIAGADLATGEMEYFYIDREWAGKPPLILLKLIADAIKFEKIR